MRRRSAAGACRPSALRCQLIDLKAGQKETLDYVTPSLTIVRYELDGSVTLIDVEPSKRRGAAATWLAKTVSDSSSLIIVHATDCY